MGRRAKNKQGDPTPIRDPDITSTKKPGKRKAEDDGAKRSPKKIKAASGPLVNKGKGKENAKPQNSNAKAKGKETIREESLGWEDIGDEDGILEAHAAYE